MDDDLWDDSAADREDAPLTEEERAEIDRRMADHARDPASAIPWEEVRERLLRRFS